MVSTVGQGRGWLGRIVRAVGWRTSAGDTDDDSKDVDFSDPKVRAASLIHRELNGIRLLVGRSPVAIEATADSLWLEVALREHVERADDDELVDRARQAARWNLERFRDTHVETTTGLADLLAGPDEGPATSWHESLIELRDSCEALERGLRGGWLQTEFERGAKDPAEKAARERVADGVGEVWERALTTAEAILDER